MTVLYLYHGGEKPVFSPLLQSPQRVRPLDFGSGFYTTTSLEQAKKWVALRIRQHQYASGCISHYTFDTGILSSHHLKILKFNGPEEGWCDFVMKNRHVMGYAHDYDIVSGPVANDNVYETLTLFEDGILSKQEAITRLRTYVLVDQLLFYTQAALQHLVFLTSETLP